jgi:hypothetical protein
MAIICRVKELKDNCVECSRDGWTDVHVEEQSGLPSVVSEWSYSEWKMPLHNFRTLLCISTNSTHCSLQDCHS